MNCDRHWECCAGKIRHSKCWISWVKYELWRDFSRDECPRGVFAADAYYITRRSLINLFRMFDRLRRRARMCIGFRHCVSQHEEYCVVCCAPVPRFSYCLCSLSFSAVLWKQNSPGYNASPVNERKNSKFNVENQRRRRREKTRLSPARSLYIIFTIVVFLSFQSPFFTRSSSAFVVFNFCSGIAHVYYWISCCGLYAHADGASLLCRAT